ncbi:glycosyltransferase family 2 protein [Mucilaginibacter sp. ZT4R22]|uniref:Glycosyltransferase family 2 protein n=1 Tax=Mucilaginibacter pankratovii TaxID=2772110 RepID=A0ABR7WM91_9SPHI|nr:glycosyltransferase family 2 protein [Mucilaginibacter pankratovii]MBD1363421.1 glycosyltransferase family 2 protein [Mucilaginibacter pankratovii]
MYLNKKVVVVLPSYNASATLTKTYAEIPFDLVDEVVLVDDKSYDNTVEIAKGLGINHIVVHDINRGYGGNQKSCYDKALALDADIVVMLHPDYQYSPKLLRAMVSVIGEGLYEVMFGSRILGKGALKGGMPMYKYISNRVLTLAQNILMNQKLSEYHTGYRAYSAAVLKAIPYHKNSDDFVFDNQVVAQIFYAKFEIGEITCPTKYFEGASSISFSRSVSYGIGVLGVSFRYFLTKIKVYKWDLLTF